MADFIWLKASVSDAAAKTVNVPRMTGAVAWLALAATAALPDADASAADEDGLLEEAGTEDGAVPQAHSRSAAPMAKTGKAWFTAAIVYHYSCIEQLRGWVDKSIAEHCLGLR
ncbi:MAG TPA: hypothetical protein VKU60_01245 [Chloroflexota bacterium]|nr:hypothetical protein [Chloroflexota bacterium]